MNLAQVFGIHFWEDGAIIDANAVVAMAVEGLVAESLEISDTREGDVDHAVEEVVHFLPSQGGHDAIWGISAEFEVGNCFLSLGYHRSLAGNGADILQYVAEVFAGFEAGAYPHIHYDFL